MAESVIVDAQQRLADALTVLAGAGVVATVVSTPRARPVGELLVAPHAWRRAVGALDTSPWRWRVGADGAARLGGRALFTFDSGATIIVEKRLPTAPWAPGRLLRLSRVLRRAGARGGRQDDASQAGEIVAAAVAAVREGASGAQLDALRSLAATVDRGAVLSLARRGGVLPEVRSALTAAETGHAPDSSTPVRTLDRIARAARRKLRPQPLSRLAAGQLLGAAVTRCRFSGLELLAGPGVFLPRAASEATAAAADHAVPEGRGVVVDVGTGCGAVALVLAQHHPGARVIGTDIDPHAIRWARRNARRLGLSVEFAVGSLLDPVPANAIGAVDVLVANIPCVVEADLLRESDAGAHAYAGTDADGLGLHRAIASDALTVLRRPGTLVIQLAPQQVAPFREHLVSLGYDAASTTGDGVAVVVTATVS